ncbi:MAG: nucleoside triphosphate pyrophosphohydrolase [Candidatus Saccharimonadales bacterium]
MPTFRFDKLVRDKIAKWHIESGHTPVTRQLVGADLIAALCKKLHEEADEVNGALDKDELTEEMADVQQILHDLCAVAGVDMADLEKVRVAKAERKGGFQEGVYIDTVYMPHEDDKWVAYCRKSPEKYPELADNDG